MANKEKNKEINPIWQPVSNIDLNRRKPLEWAKIYYVKLKDETIDGLWNEYEWAYNYMNLKYYPIKDVDGEFNTYSDMNLRAEEIYRDIYMGADMGERYILTKKGQYVETEWVRKRLIGV